MRPAQWSLPAPLDREVAATLDGQILVLGGNRDGGPTAIVDTIDPRTGAARRLALLASAEHDAAGGMLAGRPAMFGGGAGTATDAVQVVQAGGTTTVVGHLPHARADVASASARGVVYVVGGYDGATLTPDVLATTDGVSFRVVGQLPIGVRYPAVAIAGEKLFVIGGATSGGENAGVDTDAVQVVDLRSGSVSVLAHMPVTLSHATAVVLHGTVYVLGGHVGGAWSDQVATFDPTTGALHAVAHLPRAVSDGAATVVAGTAYLLGGETGPNAPIADVVEIRAPRQR
ncbi:MAG: Kelch repeat-containing protein [Actinomycetia bacterium]|nr:Kelch repeat-containing protein [Actinomycetes bacterium]